MIQSRPYDFMVKNTPQREWIEGAGVLIALAFFLGGVSGGLYLASLYFGNTVGMFISWLLAILMGLVDMAHLSKPFRFWRMMLKPKSSWIARGFIFITLFIGCAAIQLALGFWFPGTVFETVFKVLAGILAFGVSIYSGFVVGYVGAIKLWNSAIVPLLFVVAGLIGGLAILMAVTLANNAGQVVVVGNFMRIMLVVYAVFVVIYLWIATYESSIARDSVMRIIKGNIAPVFWLGVVLLIIPLAILLAASSGLAVWLITAVVCVIVGGVSLRYVILKAGMYSPLVPSG
jgi:formate-dependent nitrite reductase membrane component NrfD